MQLRDVITPELIRLDLPAGNKQEAIEALLDILMTSGKVRDRERALSCVLERERQISTGIQHGIAIPHGKCDAVDELIACVALKKSGIDFDSLDGEPSRIFFMTLSPKDRTGPHIQLLAQLSNVLKEAETRERLLSATSREEILNALCD